MDQRVLEALAKWPNVPACSGWLRLDRRGQWRMRDEACQAAGDPGEPIRHPALKAFIERNYESDDAGRWFFQNGPQRVFVDLAYTPWVVRLHDGVSGTAGTAGAIGSASGVGATAESIRLIDQCGGLFEPEGCWLDDAGNILFSRGGERPSVALLHDHDLGLVTEYMNFEADDGDEPTSLTWTQGLSLQVRTIAAADVSARFGFVQAPVC